MALSGPTHAEEVARDLPTAIAAACAEEEAAKTVQKIFNTPTFRVYTNDDRRGTELGGAIKNVIALAVGIALGLGYGDNAKAALITRGNAELARLGAAMGCKPETFAGLSGMGDLNVTCTSMHRRPQHAVMLASTHCPPPAALPDSTRSRCPSCRRWRPSSTASLRPAAP